MNPEIDQVKEDFAKRLHQAMDQAGFEVRGRARILSKEFKISDKGAGKWLNGESIPETAKIPLLADFVNVSAEWLLSGNGAMQPSQTQSQSQSLEFSKAPRNPKLLKLIEKLMKLDSESKLTNKDLTYIDHFLDTVDKANG